MRQEQRREVAFSHSDDCAKSHRSAEARRADLTPELQNLVISIHVSRVVMCSFDGPDLALHTIVRLAMDFYDEEHDGANAEIHHRSDSRGCNDGGWNGSACQR